MSLVVDAYSRKIIGYNLSDFLAALQAKMALEQAIKASSGNYKSTIVTVEHSMSVTNINKSWLKII